jgi:AcrR family transcriptional regulator
MSISEETNRRELILEAAGVVIGERGVDAARMADIAEQAGVSLGLVQHYFRHRDRLLAEVFHHQLHRVDRSWRSFVQPESPPLEQLIDYIALCIPADADSSSREYTPRWDFWLELWSKGHRDPSIGAQVPGVYKRFAVPFTQAIEEGIAAGAFAPSCAVADVVDRLVALIDGLSVQTLLAGMGPERMLTLMVDALCRELDLDSHSRKQAAGFAVHALSRLGVGGSSEV